MPYDWIDDLKMIRSLSLEVSMQRSERRFVLGDNICRSPVFVYLTYERKLIAFIANHLFWDVSIAIILEDRDTAFLWSSEQVWLLHSKKDSNSRSSEFFSCNTTHSMCRYHLALFVLPHGKWGLGNHCKY